MMSQKFIDPTFNIMYYIQSVLNIDVSKINWEYDSGFRIPTYRVELILTNGNTGSIIPIMDDDDPTILVKYLVVVEQIIVSSILPEEFEVIRPVMEGVSYRKYIYHMNDSYKRLKNKQNTFSKLAKIFINTAYALYDKQSYDILEHRTVNNVLLNFQISKN